MVVDEGLAARPDVVLGGGGYVAGPMVLAARLSRIPAALTEAGEWFRSVAQEVLSRVTQIPEEARDYFLERKYPSYGNLAPRDISSRSAKEACDEGRGVGPGGLGVYLDFADAIARLGADVSVWE